MPPFNSSKIKDVFIELVGNYSFQHGAPNEDNPFFIGRERERKRLELLIEQSEPPSGAYLIAGYRGMGKTSMVDKVIAGLNKKRKEKYEQIKISLSQEEVNDLDILRPIAHQLYLQWKEQFNKLFNNIYVCLGYIFSPLFLIWFIIDFFISWDLGIIDYIVKSWTNPEVLAWTCFGAILLTFLIIHSFVLKGHRKILKRLKHVDQRLFSLYETETEVTLKGEFTSWAPLATNGRSRSKNNFPIAPTKEIEKELIQILEEINRYRSSANHILKWRFKLKIPKYIITIDELDKIEPNYIFNPEDNESTQKLLNTDINVFGGNKIKKGK
ncbi:MAG: ATP-binding protein [Haliscomenobacter sp.]|nr:ATP-binding protein [Haliscomenobacter sp.]